MDRLPILAASYRRQHALDDIHPDVAAGRCDVSIFVLFNRMNLLDTHLGLIILFAGINLPMLLAGWAAQRQLVTGLTMGALK